MTLQIWKRLLLLVLTLKRKSFLISTDNILETDVFMRVNGQNMDTTHECGFAQALFFVFNV